MNDERARPREMQAEIVSIGTELLLGEITDTNAAWIARQLPALGIPLYRCSQVGDNLARLVETLREGWGRANLLILSGGLGPTEDDLTREAIATLLGESMAVVPALERELRAFFAGRNRAMPERNVKQATLIPSAGTLANPIGTAPGWWVASGGRYIAAMPGVPVEMRRMWSEQVTPRLLALPRGGAIVSRTLKILGIGESAVEEQLGELVRGANPTVATYAKSDGIHVRIAARARDDAQARSLIAGAEGQIRALFGQSIYGADDESLAESTLKLLAARDLRYAVLEMGMGGALCALLASERMEVGAILPRFAPPEDRPAAAGGSAIGRAPGSRDAGDRLMVSAWVAPGADGTTEMAASVLHAGNALERTERNRVDPSDAPRRAALLAVQLVREALL